MSNRKTKKSTLRPVTKITIVFLATISILFCFIWFYQYTSYTKLIDAEREITKKIQREQQIKSDLEKEIVYQNSDAFIEDIARKELDMIKPNQMKIVYDKSFNE